MSGSGGGLEDGVADPRAVAVPVAAGPDDLPDEAGVLPRALVVADACAEEVAVALAEVVGFTEGDG